MMRRFVTLSVLSLFIVGFAGLSVLRAHAETKAEDKTIEIVFFNPDTTAKNPVDATNALQTFANVVGMKLNLNIRAYFFKKQKDLERFLGEKKVEYGILSQMFLVENKDKYNLVPFAAPIRNGKKVYRIAIVVRKDKEFNDLQDLKGTVLAATALGDDNIPFYNQVVFRNEIDVQKHFKEIKIVDSVHSAVLAVLFGQADAAAVTVTSFNITKELNPQVDKNLKSIFTSEETPISPMCYFADNADPKLLPELTRILLETHLDPVGRQSCLAFNVEAWEKSGWEDYKETERIVMEASKGTTVASTHKQPGTDGSASSAAADANATAVKTPEKATIKRVQLYQSDDRMIICNAWVDGLKKPENAKTTLQYQISGGAMQTAALAFSSDNKFSVSVQGPEQAATGDQSAEVVYTVKPGDTLGKIAERMLGSSTKYMLIVAFNQIKDPNVIQVGQKLKIMTGDVTITEITYHVVCDDGEGTVVKTQPKKVIL